MRALALFVPALVLACAAPKPVAQAPPPPVVVTQAVPTKPVGPRVPSIYESAPFSVPLWDLRAHPPGERVVVTRVDCINEQGRTRTRTRCAPRGELPLPEAMFADVSFERLARCVQLEERPATKELVDLMLRGASQAEQTRAAGGGLILTRILVADVGETSHSSGCPSGFRGGCDPIMMTELGPPGSGTPRNGQTSVCLGASCQFRFLGGPDGRDFSDLFFPPDASSYYNFDRRFILDQHVDIEALRKRLDETPRDAEPLEKEAAIAFNLIHLAILAGDHDAIAWQRPRLDAAWQRAKAAAAASKNPSFAVEMLAKMRDRADGILNGTVVATDPCAAPALQRASMVPQPSYFAP